VTVGARADYASLEEETALREVTSRKSALGGRSQISVGEYSRMNYLLYNQRVSLSALATSQKVGCSSQPGRTVEISDLRLTASEIKYPEIESGWAVDGTACSYPDACLCQTGTQARGSLSHPEWRLRQQLRPRRRRSHSRPVSMRPPRTANLTPAPWPCPSPEFSLSTTRLWRLTLAEYSKSFAPGAHQAASVLCNKKPAGR